MYLLDQAMINNLLRGRSSSSEKVVCPAKRKPLNDESGEAARA